MIRPGRFRRSTKRRLLFLGFSILLVLTWFASSRSGELNQVWEKAQRWRTAGNLQLKSRAVPDLPGDDRLCHGWTSELAIQETFLKKRCWRAIWHQQLEAFNPDPFDVSMNFPKVKQRNHDALDRLRLCLNETAPLANGHKSNTQSDCSNTAFKVVVGNYAYYTFAFIDEGESGETVWLRTQIEAMREMGYTVLCSTSLPGSIRMHRTLPDIIGQFWMQDLRALECQADPRCIADFRPTRTTYPTAPESIMHNNRTRWLDEKKPENNIGYKWMWDREEIEAIPQDERGTIPLWKIFVATYWGTMRESPNLFNPLAKDWTLGPYKYDGATYLPYSYEKYCAKVDVVPHDQRPHRAMVLAKANHYFDYPYAPSREDWPVIVNGTGLDYVTTSVSWKGPDDPFVLPYGVKSTGVVHRDKYAAMLGESKLLLGIGRPSISPSIYAGLCLGVPSVLPYFKSDFPPKGGDPNNVFNEEFAQHGPAQLLGPPYVYSYRHGNATDLVEKINEAVRHPIGSFLDPDMTWAAVQERLSNMLTEDWRGKYESILQGNGGQVPAPSIHFLQDCFSRRECRSSLDYDKRHYHQTPLVVLPGQRLGSK